VRRDREAHVQQRHPRRDPDRLHTHAPRRQSMQTIGPQLDAPVNGESRHGLPPG
jgi:hypothetical protein